MQSASQASVKMQAHKDKIINQVATATKQRFLMEEINYLTDFKENLEVLNQVAKPSANLSLQISKISNRIQKQFLTALNEEILLIRREISLEQINDASHFQAKIAQFYEERIEEYGHKLEHMQCIVQESQQRRRSKQKIDFSSSALNFKSVQTRKTVEAFIAQKLKIKNILRDRLLLYGKIIKIAQKQKHQLAKSQQNYHNYGTYQFLTTHKGLYRNKSRDRGLAQCETTISKSSKKKRISFSIPPILLQNIQRQVFIEQLEKIKKHNSKLEVSISLLKKAVAQKEDQKLLEQLSKNKNLIREQTIARQIFAFQKLSQRFQEKLQKCSYKWVFQQKITLRKGESMQQDWQKERLLSNRSKVSTKSRAKSADKQNMEQTSQFSIAQVNKSNIKTSCSLQVMQN